jgi:hypothetical protein
MKRLALSLGLALAVVGFSGGIARAMPPFAQAYGVKCELCHTQVPQLNAYGRYVQRSGYASLDPHVLRTAFPIWVGEQLNYDSSVGNAGGSYKPQGGNLAIHAVGAIGNDITYHFQQWIWEDNGAGDLDTFWVAYNNLLHRDGHLFAGLIEAPGPSAYSQWADIAPFAPPEITVGEHVYQEDGNRWGAKLNYVKGDVDVEAGWLYANNGWSGFSNWANTDKTFQYKVAYASATNPFEIGLLGSRGSVPVSTGVDQYYTVGGYAQRDPTGYIPGALVLFQSGYDANPGADPNTGLSLGQAFSNGWTTELYDTFFKGRLFLSAREEWTQDGLGTFTNYGNVNASIVLAKYLRFYVQESMQNGQTPTWQYFLWLTTPVTKGPNGW